ncbi:MAG TPA: hypothetical protein VNR36_11145 [Pseudolysinimonas sp.]|nr:hypothetical protein [Pseudolysinimonas sp.]
MSRLTDRVSAWLLRRRPVSAEEFAEVADWVNEGGALDPAGPPPLDETGGDDPVVAPTNI